ncbi:tetratricopeptide repeat protein [Flavobacterium ardleyense]|uniref:tetratricopeptide repeat protein n=1 Tax=Flavobacterium ardleyense TaxID=2038737 RepID=UPI00298CA037|nr:hypothetical protein [Flavobacterium ardleyense]
MSKILTLLFFLAANLTFSQNYMEGKRLYCKSENPEAMKSFDGGIEILYLNKTLDKKYLKLTAEVFFEAYQKDTTFCDALFFTGYTMSLLGDQKAISFYLMADSLANNRSVEFKINLASEFIKFGTEKSITLARKKYNEIKQYFPEDPEGYYGLALTSAMFGEPKIGLENLDISVEKYKKKNLEVRSEVVYLRGILLAQDKQYEEGLVHLERSYDTHKRDEQFKIHYALCLLKVSEIRRDPKMMQKAKKIYDKIEDKSSISAATASLLVF